MKGVGEPADLRLLIILLRAIQGWNQAELAKAARVDKASISDYEQGIKAPSQRTLERILAAAGMPFSELERVLQLLRTIRLHTEETNRLATGNALPQAVTEIAAAELAAASLEIPALAGAAREEPPSLLAVIQERLREESARAGTDGERRSSELAELASRVAELASGK
jgi:transcriptional regulator with XRE-family HTH domain